MTTTNASQMPSAIYAASVRGFLNTQIELAAKTRADLAAAILASNEAASKVLYLTGNALIMVQVAKYADELTARLDRLRTGNPIWFRETVEEYVNQLESINAFFPASNDPGPAAVRTSRECFIAAIRAMR